MRPLPRCEPLGAPVPSRRWDRRTLWRPSPQRKPADTKEHQSPPHLATNRGLALLGVAAQGAEVRRWSRTIAIASRWVSPEPAENA